MIGEAEEKVADRVALKRRDEGARVRSRRQSGELATRCGRRREARGDQQAFSQRQAHARPR